MSCSSSRACATPTSGVRRHPRRSGSAPRPSRAHGAAGSRRAPVARAESLSCAAPSSRARAGARAASLRGATMPPRRSAASRSRGRLASRGWRPISIRPSVPSVTLEKATKRLRVPVLLPQHGRGDEHELLDHVRVADRELEGDEPAHRVSDHDRGVDPAPREELAQRRAHSARSTRHRRPPRTRRTRAGPVRCSGGAARNAGGSRASSATSRRGRARTGSPVRIRCPRS